MKLDKPRLAAAPEPCADAGAAVDYAMREAEDVRGLLFSGGELVGCEAVRIRFSGCVFENWRFTDCRFLHVDFADVLFRGCDLSNLDLTGCGTMRCAFVDCKGVGL